MLCKNICLFCNDMYDYFTYTLSDVSLQVNLDFYTREVISRSLEQPGPTCFVVAQRKIYSLMENDSFPRFIQSEQYKILLDSASELRGIGKHRKALKMKSTGELIRHNSNPITLESKFFSLHNHWQACCCKRLLSETAFWCTSPSVKKKNHLINSTSYHTESCNGALDAKSSRHYHLEQDASTQIKLWCFWSKKPLWRMWTLILHFLFIVLYKQNAWWHGIARKLTLFTNMERCGVLKHLEILDLVVKSPTVKRAVLNVTT